MNAAGKAGRSGKQQQQTQQSLLAELYESYRDSKDQERESASDEGGDPAARHAAHGLAHQEQGGCELAQLCYV